MTRGFRCPRGGCSRCMSTTLPSLSRFAPQDILGDNPDLKKKVLRALASAKNKPVKLTSDEADFLIADGGGPDPDRAVPQAMFIYQNRALVVRGGDIPSCWRL